MSKSAIQVISDDLGIDLGYLYIVDSDNTTILESIVNNADGVKIFRSNAVINAPHANNMRAWAKIKINSYTGTGDLTGVTIAAVNQLGAANPITLTGLSATQIAAAITTGLNDFDPGTAVDITATYFDDEITLYAPVSIGSAANVWTIALPTGAGTLDTDITNFSGGFSNTEDTSCRHFWLNADYDTDSCAGGATASPTVLGNAVEVTSVIVPKSQNSAPVITVQTIDTGVIDFERKANITIVALNGEGGLDDTLTDINTNGRASGDLLFLIRGSAGNTITVTDTGNISIDQSIDFDIDSVNKTIVLAYNSATNSFNEKLRSSAFSVTVAAMRAALIPQPVSGTETITFGLGGGTESRTPGTDKGCLICLGTGLLTSSHTINGDGSPLDGETWIVDYRATFTAGGNNFTIFGYSLTDTQMLNGALLVMATWDSTGGVYRTRVLVDLGTAGSIEDAMIPVNEISSTKLALSGAAAGSYTNLNATIDAQGVITAAASGSSASATGPFVENIALVYGAANDMRLTGANGSIFSASNVGKVLIPSTAGARTLIVLDVTTNTHYFIDDVGTSDIIGEEFGVTAGVVWGEERPFYLYACNLNDTSASVKFAISPNPCAIAVPAAANCGYHGNPAATPSDNNFFFLSETTCAAYAAHPCALIGCLRMTMSAADDWTVVTDAQGFETGINPNPFFGYWYTMPVSQMGATATKYMKDHAGTAPMFTNNYYRYKLGRDGYVDAEIYLDADVGTDGAGAVTAQIALPYLYQNTIFNGIIGCGFSIDATPVTVNVVAQAIANSTSCELVNDTVVLTNASYVNGARTISLKLRYQAFFT